jgi:hypothetical protein
MRATSEESSSEVKRMTCEKNVPQYRYIQTKTEMFNTVQVAKVVQTKARQRVSSEPRTTVSVETEKNDLIYQSW